MSIAWKDVSSYSRGGPRIPTAWECCIGDIRIRVHRHIDYPGAWLMSCVPVIIDKKPLKSAGIAPAKDEAIVAVDTWLAKNSDTLHGAYGN